MLATMNQIVNLLSGFQKQFPPTNNQLRTSSNSRTHATVHDGQIVTETVQRRAPGNVGNTSTRGTQNYGQVTDNKGKLVICYNCHGEGHVDHEDAYDSDVDEEPHALAAFMVNLSSTGGTHGASTSQVNEEEQLDSNVDLVIDDNTIPYHQYQIDSKVQDVPTVVSSASPGQISMVTILDDLRTQLDGHLKVNQEQGLVNNSLRAELERCKLEMQRLDSHKVKLELDQTIVDHNKRNAELEKENVLLKINLSQKDESINSLKSESQKVISEKKDREEGYLKEIVCLKNANKVATGLLQKFQQPTQTILMLSKRPNIATHDLHKTALGSSNPWYFKQAKLCQPTLYDGHALLNPAHTPVSVLDSEETLVQAEVSRAKMSEGPGTIPPINYAKLNALYDHFVPQKVLSLEQVYWLPVKEIASQASNSPKHLDTEYEQTVLEKKSLLIEKKNLLIQNECLIADSITKDGCSIVIALDIVVPPSLTCLCEELRLNCDREHSKVVELEAEILKSNKCLLNLKNVVPLFEKNHINFY
ncbi:hypothetical protein Tco_1091786 [Tanacetum coccineum]|uniref:Uncharacterized protein n=1 Tax=Tanacetum coccineum TaxID=301880 RepID=A0ABQ5I850_9ASTR